MSLKESQKREDELVQQSADRLAVTRKDKGRKRNLKTPSKPGFCVVMRPKPPRNKKTLVEDELKQYFEMGVRGEKKTEVVAGKTSKSSKTNSQKLADVSSSLMDLVKEHGWYTDKADMIRLWSSCQQASQGRRQFSAIQEAPESSGPWSWTTESDRGT